jgi:cell division transport system ATP-binding protein
VRRANPKAETVTLKRSHCARHSVTGQLLNQSSPKFAARVPRCRGATAVLSYSADRNNPDGPSPMIRLENVTKSYSADVVAVRDAGFDIAKGEFVFLVGPSGSGKSTLLRMLNRQDRPERGAVWVAGRNIVDMPPGRVPHLRRNIGNIFQDYKLLLEKTVFENVAFAQEVIGRPKHVIKQQVPAVLELVGLAGKEDRLPHQLSGGEQQRVSVARAFVNRPLILLADEPTGNLDPATGEGIMRLLDRINKTGTTVVMATHDQRIVNTMRKRVIQLDRGVIVRDQARGVYE